MSGINLDFFFNQWFYGQGFPSYHAIWKQENNTVSIHLDQTTSHNSVPFYKMPVPVQLIGQFKDTTFVLDHVFSGQEFVLNPGFPVVSIQIDPELHLLSAHNSANEINVSNDPILVYPNPAMNYLHLYTVNNANPVTRYEIMDNLGRKVYCSAVFEGLQKTIPVAISSLCPGTYLLRVELKSGEVYRKFIRN